MSSNGNVMNTASPKKKRTKKALEKKHKDPLPITLANDSLTWTQYVVNALYNLIGWHHTNERQFNGEYSPEGGFICITDNSDIQELYRKGFFGKGNLSRSEPTWSQRIAAEGSGKLPFILPTEMISISDPSRQTPNNFSRISLKLGESKEEPLACQS
jgi:ATP-dependent Clp protease adapter protein ClpS